MSPIHHRGDGFRRRVTAAAAVLAAALALPGAAASPGDGFVLRAPASRAEFEIPKGASRVTVTLSGWYCTDRLEALAREVAQLLEALVEAERAERPTVPQKRALLQLAEALRGRAEADVEAFWEVEPARRWVMDMAPGAGRSVLERAPCYRRADLERAKRAALHWARMVREEYADARRAE